MLEDIMTLAEAAEELGIAPVTLRAAVDRGRLRARKVGQTYVTTRDEVDRYRDESLGRAGRPANLLAQRPPFEDVLGKPGEPNMLEQRPPFEDVPGKPGDPNILEDRDR